MSRGTLAILSQSRRFYYCWRTLQLNNAGFQHRCSFNLKRESRLFIQSINSKCMSLANLSEPEIDLRKFLKYLVKAYIDGRSTEFDGLLQHHQLRKLVDERIKILENIESLAEFDKDQEMKKLAEEEKLVNENRLKEIDNEMITLILENFSRNSCTDVIMEITAGVGGQEAMLFVKDLLEMYTKHLTYLGYTFDIIALDETAQGGYRYASIMISGKDAYEKLQHEGGVHRVQRVPATEKSGRIHTSVVSVSVLPQPTEIEVVINPNDLKIDTMRASGAGGQHVNTTNSAVRVTHLPTGTVAECQVNRSQIRNREIAIAKVRAIIYQNQLNKQLKSATNLRKQQMGMGERNEKIRTYNYSQGRVTDHRLLNGTLHNLKGFMDGGEALNNFHIKLRQELQYKLLLEAVKSIS